MPGERIDSADLEVVGDYELQELIGRGGMGLVYKARQISLNRIVALKMISHGRHASAEERRRFQTEAEAAATLDHPNVVSIHEFGEHDGRPYYSMDFVDGFSLASVIRKAPLSATAAATLARDIARAVAHAHANHVLHRDLKPSNILLTADHHPRVADFGLAKLVQRDLELTRTGDILGTPQYMAPEQALGQVHRIGPPCDIYGLGAILYATLTGRAPFEGTEPVEVLRKVSEELPLPPRRYNSAIDRELETICLKCLEKQIEDRYDSAAAVADDLQRYLDGNPISVSRRGFAREVLHWSRHPQRVAQAAVNILIISAFYGLCSVIGICVLLFGLVQPTDPVKAATIVGLDTLGFVVCLPIGLGVLARKGWMIRFGTFVGAAMTAIVLGLMVTGFDAGGLLAEPFMRVSTYVIFGFVGIVMTLACLVAWISHSTWQRAAGSSIMQTSDDHPTTDAETVGTTAVMDPID